MTDQELRAMVRDAIARRLAVSDTVRVAADTEPDPERDFRANIAFTLLPLTRGGDGDGPCLIEEEGPLLVPAEVAQTHQAITTMAIRPTQLMLLTRTPIA